MGDALKACDWCRGEAKLWTGNPAGMAGSMTWDVAVQCVSCGARGPVFRDGAYSEDGQRDKAIAAWNRRAPLPVALNSIATINDVADRIALYAPHHAAKDYQAAARAILAMLREKGGVG